MRELSLFTGAGGGVLGSLLLGWETIGYVEWDKYCQQIIAARIADGHLPVAPIFGDVREFILSGAADQYRGFADVVSGGFPCQPFSVAGKRAGADDHRNMWPATIECIRRVQPRYAFLENVPGLLASGYFGTILGDLAESGYDARWRILSAAELGAPHKRDRLWIVAHAQSESGRDERNNFADGQGRARGSFASAHSCDVPNADSAKRRRDGTQRQAHQRNTQSARDGEPWTVAHAESARDNRLAEGNEAGERRRQSSNSGISTYIPHRQLIRLEGEQQARTAQGATYRSGNGSNPGWWEVEPNVGRVADGVAARVDRLRAIGNGQVPAVAAAAWRLLTQDF